MRPGTSIGGPSNRIQTRTRTLSRANGRVVRRPIFRRRCSRPASKALDLRRMARGLSARGNAYHARRGDNCSTVACMLDLGLSFLGSVARDPNALAVVDGEVRLTYAQWYRRISALVAGLDSLGLVPGDRIVTALGNRWEAATLHWACQFSGVIITPVNWRSTAG